MKLTRIFFTLILLASFFGSFAQDETTQRPRLKAIGDTIEGGKPRKRNDNYIFPKVLADQVYTEKHGDAKVWHEGYKKARELDSLRKAGEFTSGGVFQASDSTTLYKTSEALKGFEIRSFKFISDKDFDTTIVKMEVGDQVFINDQEFEATTNIPFGFKSGRFFKPKKAPGITNYLTHTDTYQDINDSTNTTAGAWNDISMVLDKSGYSDPMGGTNAIRVATNGSLRYTFLSDYGLKPGTQYTTDIWLRGDTAMSTEINWWYANSSCGTRPLTLPIELDTVWKHFSITWTYDCAEEGTYWSWGLPDLSSLGKNLYFYGAGHAPGNRVPKRPVIVGYKPVKDRVYAVQVYKNGTANLDDQSQGELTDSELMDQWYNYIYENDLAHRYQLHKDRYFTKTLDVYKGWIQGTFVLSDSHNPTHYKMNGTNLELDLPPGADFLRFYPVPDGDTDRYNQGIGVRDLRFEVKTPEEGEEPMRAIINGRYSLMNRYENLYMVSENTEKDAFRFGIYNPYTEPYRGLRQVVDGVSIVGAKDWGIWTTSNAMLWKNSKINYSNNGVWASVSRFWAHNSWLEGIFGIHYSFRGSQSNVWETYYEGKGGYGYGEPLNYLHNFDVAVFGNNRITAYDTTYGPIWKADTGNVLALLYNNINTSNEEFDIGSEVDQFIVRGYNGEVSRFINAPDVEAKYISVQGDDGTWENKGRTSNFISENSLLESPTIFHEIKIGDSTCLVRRSYNLCEYSRLPDGEYNGIVFRNDTMYSTNTSSASGPFFRLGEALDTSSVYRVTYRAEMVGDDGVPAEKGVPLFSVRTVDGADNTQGPTIYNPEQQTYSFLFKPANPVDYINTRINDGKTGDTAYVTYFGVTKGREYYPITHTNGTMRDETDTLFSGTTKIASEDYVNQRIEDTLQHYQLEPLTIPFSSNRDVLASDIGNTISCTANSIYRLTENFSEMAVGDRIYLQCYGGDLTIESATGVLLNGIAPNNMLVSGFVYGYIEKMGANEYALFQ